jgi:hypothetical protein
MSPRKLATDPQILDMPAQKMAVVSGKGAPDKVFAQIMPALYGSVYTLKFSLKKQGKETFKVLASRARYPDAHIATKESWNIILGIPIPGDTQALPQKVAGTEVKIETWPYGKVAQILHLGAYNKEDESIARLHKLIEESGYQISGPHEEEYLTRPDAKVMKTIIRYEIKKKE